MLIQIEIQSMEVIKMIRPLLATHDPYKTAKLYELAGWKVDFIQPIESDDPLVGVSLYDNSVLLGLIEGYVSKEAFSHIGKGILFCITVPIADIKQIYEKHRAFSPTPITVQPWGDTAFEVKIGDFKYMIIGK